MGLLVSEGQTTAPAGSGLYFSGTNDGDTGSIEFDSDSDVGGDSSRAKCFLTGYSGAGAKTNKFYIGRDGSASFAGTVSSGDVSETTLGGNGARMRQYGDITIRRDGSKTAAFSIWKDGAATGNQMTALYNDGSATFAGDCLVGTSGIRFTDISATGGIQLRGDSANANENYFLSGEAEDGTQLTVLGKDGSASFAKTVDITNGQFKVNRATGGANGSNIVNQQNGTTTGLWMTNPGIRLGGSDVPTSPLVKLEATDGTATFAGNITAANVTFNLEPENPDNYTTTEEEYEVEVPVLRPDGPVTADLVDGEPEQEMQTITRTREVKTYTGPTMDVKDTLLKITEALTQLKTAAASATTCEELRTAIDTALADV